MVHIVQLVMQAINKLKHNYLHFVDFTDGKSTNRLETIKCMNIQFVFSFEFMQIKSNYYFLTAPVFF